MFHSSNPSLFGRPIGVLRGSEALQSTLSELRGACVSLSTNVPHSLPATFRLLSNFSGQLTDYLGSQGSAGYFDTIARECPSLEPQARVLEQGHECLRVSAKEANELGRTAETICTLGISRHVTHLLDSFETHERAEAKLLQDFFQNSGERGTSRAGLA